MFKNYKLDLTSYIPTNRNTPLCNRVEKHPLEEYNSLGELIGYTWNSGDSVVLEFLTDGNVVYEDSDFTTPGLGHSVSAEEYLKGKKVKLQIINFRYEVVYEAECEAQTLINFEIKSNTLCDGTYKCSLQLYDATSSIDLVKFSDCTLYIR